MPVTVAVMFMHHLHSLRVNDAPSVEHTADADALTDGKRLDPSLGGAVDIGCETTDFDAITLLSTYQPFDQGVTHSSSEGEAWIPEGLRHIQLLTVPGAAHQYLTRGWQHLIQGQAMQVARFADITDGTDTDQTRRSIYAAGYHLALRIAHAADTHRLANAQARRYRAPAATRTGWPMTRIGVSPDASPVTGPS